MKLILSFLLFYFSLTSFFYHTNAFAADAVISGPQVVTTGSDISLTSELSQGNNLEFRWELEYRPKSSNAKLAVIDQSVTSLIVDREGLYVISLFVIENGVSSTKDFFTIHSSLTSGEIVWGEKTYTPSTLCSLTFGLYDCQEVVENIDISDTAGSFSFVLNSKDINKVNLSLNAEDLTQYYTLSGEEDLVAKSVPLNNSNELKVNFDSGFGTELSLAIRKDEALDSTQNSQPQIITDEIIYSSSLGSQTQIDISDQDSGDSHTYKILKQAKSGEVSISEEGILSYKPDSQFQGNDSFLIAITDSGVPLKSNSKQINIRFISQNEPPIVSIQGELKSNGEVISRNILIEDTEEQSHEIRIESNANNGTVEIVDTEFIYTPNAGYIGVDSFTLVITDDGSPAESTQFVVQINVLENNLPLLNLESSAEVEQGIGARFLMIFSDVDLGQTLLSEVSIDASHGDVSLGDGVLTYTPQPDFFGVDQFEISISDNALEPGIIRRTVTVNVLENKPPEFNIGFNEINIFAGASRQIRLDGSDPNLGQTLTFSITEAPQFGEASLELNSLLYTANSDFVGVDYITVQVTDSGTPAKSDSYRLKINSRINSSPNPTVLGRRTTSGREVNLLISDNDPDFTQTHTYAIASAPSHGVLTPSPFRSSVYTYTPNPGYQGSDVFSFVVTDNGVPPLAGTVTVNMTVTANSPPAFIGATSFDVVAGSQKSFFLSALDPDPDSLSFKLIQAPEKGELSLRSNGSTSYRSNKGSQGVDSFIVEISDDGEPSLKIEVPITINILENNPPAPVDTTYNVIANSNRRFFIDANDPDPAQQISYEIMTAPSFGELRDMTRGSFTYIPTPDFQGEDSAIIRVSDDGIPALFKDITIRFVVELNSPPNPGNLSIRLLGSKPVTFFLDPNDPNPNQTFRYFSKAPPLNGSLVSPSVGFFRYTANEGFVGQDQALIDITDSGIPTGIATSSISFEVVENKAPTLSISDSTDIFKNSSGVFQVIGEDPNIENGDNSLDRLTYSIERQAINGFANISSTTGSIGYRPSLNFLGQDRITVKVQDQGLPPLSSTLEIIINVKENNPPVIIAEDFAVLQGASINRDFSFSDIDPNQNLNFSIFSQPTKGNIVINSIVNGTANITYTPLDVCQQGTDSFVIRVLDGISEVFKTVNVDITANTLPIILTESITLEQGENKDFVINFTDSDPNQNHSFSISTFPEVGNILIDSSTGVGTYFSDISNIRAASFEVQLSDGFSSCNTLESKKTISINFIPNREPSLTVEDIVTESSVEAVGQAVVSDADQFQNNSFSISVEPTHGFVFIDQTGKYFYFGNEVSIPTEDSFTVRVEDNGTPVLFSEKVVRVDLRPQNLEPVPTANNIIGLDATAYTTQVFANDPNSGQTHTFEIISNPANGNASITSDGLLTYESDLGFEGFDSVEVKVTDNGLIPLSSNLSIVVSIEKNVAPNPQDITISDAVEGMTISFNLAANDPNSSNITQSFTYELISAPASGSVSISNDGDISYEAAVGFTGDVNFSVEVSDDATIPLSGIADIAITIVENQAPVINDITLAVDQNSILMETISFTDENQTRQEFSFSIIEQGLNGSATIDNLGVLTYEPNLDFIGSDSLIIQISDNGNPALTDTATISININSSNNTVPTIGDVFFYKKSDKVPSLVFFSVEDLEDPDGEVLRIEVDYGDGSPMRTYSKEILGEDFSEFSHYYRTAGVKNLVVRAIDDKGGIGSFTKSVSIGGETQPKAILSLDKYFARSPSVITATGNASFDTDGNIVEHCLEVLELSSDNQVYDDCSESVLNTQITLTSSGQYQFNYCVIDNDSILNCHVQNVSIDESSPFGEGNARADFNITTLFSDTNSTVNLDASSSEGFDGASIQSYSWFIRKRSFDDFDLPDSFAQLFTGQVVNLSSLEPGEYKAQLEVVDNNGKIGKIEKRFYIESTNLQDPTLEISYGDFDTDRLVARIIPNGHTFISEDISWFIEANNYRSSGREIFIDNLPPFGSNFVIKVQAVSTKGERFDFEKTILFEDIELFPFGELVLSAEEVNVNEQFQLSFIEDSGVDPTSLKYTWYLDNGEVISGIGSSFQNIQFSSSIVGYHQVVLNVEDQDGRAFWQNSEFFVANGNFPNAVGSIDINEGEAPLVVNLESFSDDDGSIVNTSWELVFNDEETFFKVEGDNIDVTLFWPGIYEVYLFVEDNDGNIAETFVGNIEVDRANAAPIVESKNLIAISGQTLSSKIVFNDPSDFGQTHTFSILSQPTNGVVEVNSRGFLSYTSNQAYIGSDSFSVRVTDNEGKFGDANYSIDVQSGGNQAPVIGEIIWKTDGDMTIPVFTVFKVDNVSDIDGNIVKLIWDFKDGTLPYEFDYSKVSDFELPARVSHYFTQAGVYNVEVTAVDNQGGTTTKSKSVSIDQNIAPLSLFLVNTASDGNGGFDLLLDASLSTDLDGQVSNYCYEIFNEEDDLILDECSPNPIRTVSLDETGDYFVILSAVDDKFAASYNEQEIYFDGTIAEPSEGNFYPFSKMRTTDAVGMAPLAVDFDSIDSRAFGSESLNEALWAFDYKNETQFNYLKGNQVNYVFDENRSYQVNLTTRSTDGLSARSSQPVFTGGNAIAFNPDFTIEKNDGFSVRLDSTISKGHLDEFSVVFDMGDGNIKLDSETFYTYEKSGRYKISFFALDIYGQTAFIEKEVVIDDNSPSGIYMQSGDSIYTEVGFTENFSVAGDIDDEDIITWDFGDGTIITDTAVNARSVTHAFTAANLYQVNIRVNKANNYSYSEQSFARVVPSAEEHLFLGINSTDLSGQVPKLINFSPLASNTVPFSKVQWVLRTNDKDIVDISNEENYNFVFTEDGFYKLNLLVELPSGQKDLSITFISIFNKKITQIDEKTFKKKTSKGTRESKKLSRLNNMRDLPLLLKENKGLKLRKNIIKTIQNTKKQVK